MRTVINLNGNWKYTSGQDNSIIFDSIDDSAWKSVNVPHNTSLYTDNNKDAYQGISIYRKHFSLDKSFESKRVLLTFDGVMQRCKVYIGGRFIAGHNNGYTPFSIDISSLIHFGEDNILTVVTDSRASNDYTPGKEKPDFQYFGGIYRNVYLTVTDEIYISDVLEENTTESGIFVSAPVVEKESATVNIKAQIRNKHLQRKDILLKIAFFMDGIEVAQAEKTGSCYSNSTVVFDENITISNPSLWHPNSPDLYNIKLTVISDGKIKDTVELKYGIRKIEWRHEGLFINSEKFIAQGTNLHSDIFVLGNALPDNVAFEEIRRVKENGFDFVRMSHYPHSQAYYDACDKYGVIVLDCMSGWQNFSSKKSFQNSTFEELRTMIRLVRNHPSVVAVETSLNESNYTEKWAKAVHKIAHEEYAQNGASRIWTTGWKTNVFDVLLGASQHDIRQKADKSNKGVIISEYGDWDYGGTKSSSRVERGNDKTMLIQAQNHIESAILSRNKAWFAADALWLYMDYAGCDSTMTCCGVTDMYRIDKFSSYFFKSQRNANIDLTKYGIKSGPMVFVANSLEEDSPDDITVFSNCDEVELIKDKQSIGKAVPDKKYYGNNSRKMLSCNNLPHPTFTFENAKVGAEEITAVGYINGKEVCRYTAKKSGKSHKLHLTMVNNKPLAANGSDVKLVWISIEDENSTVVKDDDRQVSIEVQGGYVVGFESVLTRKGQTAVWIRANVNDVSDAVTVAAYTDGLVSDAVKIDIIRCSSTVNACDGNEYGGLKELETYSDSYETKARDVAREKPAFSSSDLPGCTADMGNNGEPSTFWFPANSELNYWYVDTGNIYEFEHIEISWNAFERHKYIIDTSDDCVNWKVVHAGKFSKKEIQSIEKISGRGRFVRIRFKSKPGKLQGFNMFYVYGKCIEK